MRGVKGCSCFLLFCAASGFLAVVAAAAAGTPSFADQCGAEFQKVTACLTFATGKADSPSKDCCSSVGEIKDKNPVCLCYFIQQIHSGNNAQIKSMGIQEARLLQLPSACKLSNASTAECPRKITSSISPFIYIYIICRKKNKGKKACSSVLSWKSKITDKNLDFFCDHMQLVSCLARLFFTFRITF